MTKREREEVMLKFLGIIENEIGEAIVGMEVNCSCLWCETESGQTYAIGITKCD